MTKRVWWIAVIVCAIVFGVAVVAVGAYEHGGAAAGMPGRRFQRLAARLKLTPEQQSQIKADLRQTRAVAKPDFDSVRSLRETLGRQIFTDQPNQAEIQKNAELLKQHLSAAIDEYVKVGLQINQVLTPAQRVEMQTVITERAQRAQQQRARHEQQGSPTPAPQPSVPQNTPAQPSK